jgi:hypothetical protein
MMKKLREWRADIKEYDTHIPSEDGEAFRPQSPSELFNQLKLLQSGARALAQTKGATSDPVGRVVSQVDEILQQAINRLAQVADESWR